MLGYEKVFETTNFDAFKFPRGRDIQFTFNDFEKYLTTNNVNLVPASTYVKVRSLSDERLVQYNKTDIQTIVVLSTLYKKYKTKNQIKNKKRASGVFLHWPFLKL